MRRKPTVRPGRVLGFQLPFELFCLFPASGFRTSANECAVRSKDTIDQVRAAAALVIDVVRGAGRVEARVNREHGFALFAESVVRLAYEFFLCFCKY